jgi:hypothetical protein
VNEADANQTVEMGGVSPRAVIMLIERLRLTETAEQFYCREAELDDAYRHADMDLRLAEADSSSPELIRELARIRGHVLAAHDLVGESKVSEAVEELNRIVEIKIGLGEEAPEK